MCMRMNSMYTVGLRVWHNRDSCVSHSARQVAWVLRLKVSAAGMKMLGVSSDGFWAVLFGSLRLECALAQGRD